MYWWLRTVYQNGFEAFPTRTHEASEVARILTLRFLRDTEHRSFLCQTNERTSCRN